MKILLITGSAHKKGTTAYLAEKFVQGAIEAGHEIYRFDAAFKMYIPVSPVTNATGRVSARSRTI